MGIIRLYLTYTEILLILFFILLLYIHFKKWSNSKNENSGSTIPKTAFFCFAKKITQPKFKTTLILLFCIFKKKSF